MTRLNLVLLAAVVASALYLVHIQFESRQLFVQIDRAEAEARKLAIENDRLQVEKRAQATPSRSLPPSPWRQSAGRIGGVSRFSSGAPKMTAVGTLTAGCSTR